MEADLIKDQVDAGLLYTLVAKAGNLVVTMAFYAAAFAAFSTGMVYFKQEGMLYHPAVPEEKYRYPENMPPGYKHPGEYGLPFENVKIVCKDKIKVAAWFVKANATPKSCRTILFFHGNAGNIGSRLPNIEVLVKRLNSNVLIIDYRGYGNSDGTPSEEGLRLDAEATLEWALNNDQIDNSRIYTFGRSLGGAVAAELAMNKGNSLKGVILENTFTSIADMVDQLMPMVAIFKKLIQRVFYPTIDRIGKIENHILFVRGIKDEIVPSDHTDRLFEQAKKATSKRIYACPEGDHNNTWKIGGEEYVSAFRDFFKHCEE